MFLAPRRFRANSRPGQEGAGIEDPKTASLGAASSVSSATEVARHGVTANVVVPGLIDTAMTLDMAGSGDENVMESAESNKEILEALREVLVDRLKVEAEAVTPQANLFDDLGLDSIDLMSAVMAIEERFEIEVSDAELENVTTVGEAVEILGAKVAASA